MRCRRWPLSNTASATDYSSHGRRRQRSLTIRAIYRNRLAFGDVILPLSLVTGHVDVPLAQDILVSTDNPAALTTSLGASGGRVVGRDHFTAAADSTERMNAEIGYLALGLVVAFAALAVVNSLAMATGARTREFAALRLVGMQRRQVKRMVAAETVALAGTSLVSGTAIGYGVLSAYSRGMTSGAPYARPFAVATILLGAVLLTGVATALPTRLSLRANPADTLNDLQ